MNFFTADVILVFSPIPVAPDVRNLVAICTDDVPTPFPSFDFLRCQLMFFG